ncbi:hypothetical protein E3N88_18677 [Mikania micrantha]|uniref:ABC transmembrane type-1 domain-containing protein n=1 Tax=Mikania micrantha TaxID=192012 RepID=A0A5N6NL35_9ASTR|nr:hypothetical protein E3N88_18677 [Mikania micrantha]
MAIPSNKLLEMEPRHKFIPLSTSSTSQEDPPVSPPLPHPKTEENVRRNGPELPTLYRRFYKIAAPYWFSDDKLEARTRLAIVFALTLGTTGINVGFNFLGRDFYNALADKDQKQFHKQLLYYVAAFVGGIPIFVIRDYAREILALRWRAWMTKYYMEGYLKNQTFYQIQSLSLIDNPDQRIVDDLSSFTGTALSLSLTLFNAVVDLISFSNILFSIYPPLFGVLLVYSLGGTAISVFLGKGLINLNFMQEKMEADFRFGIIRIRENAESIAFYGGEENEIKLLLKLFRRAFENLTQLLICTRNLEFFTSSYRYLIQILPAAVVSPRYFSGKIEFGVINQCVSAFNHILGDFSLIVYQFQAISAFSAVIDRLGEFDDVLDYINANDPLEPFDEIQLTHINLKDSSFIVSNKPLDTQKLLEIESLSVQTPTTKALLIRHLSITVCINEHLLITGASGSGKTSLLRAIAGLWRTGRGKITFYAKHTPDAAPNESAMTGEINIDDEKSNYRDLKGVFFLPQRPYMVLGTLRQQLLYPKWPTIQDSTPHKSRSGRLMPFFEDASGSEVASERFLVPNTDDLAKALEDVHLGYLLSRFSGLDTINEWSSVLSLGEQQRLAFARLLLTRPDLVLLDESTSALDEANEITPLELESNLPNWLIKESPVSNS